MKAIMILTDSMNRRFLSPYGAPPELTPNLNRLAERGVVFDNHWVGSMPCMPARRDIFTGRLEFLERGWGPLEPYDDDFVTELRGAGVYTHMITDHYHYFETTGEGYCQRFDSWEFERGQEGDYWVSRPGPRMSGRPCSPEYDEAHRRYLEEGGTEKYGTFNNVWDMNRARIEKDGFPTERVFSSASRWLRDYGELDNWFLMVEAFDPHEPFDCPKEFKERFRDTYAGLDFDFSSYTRAYEPPEAVERLKNNYLANLAYADHCLGKLLDVLDEKNLWRDTLVLFTTDHGHMVGEHDYTGKNVMPLYNEQSHLPLIMALPGGEGAGVRIGALSQNTDLFPTLTRHFGARTPQGVQGGSLQALVKGERAELRKSALFGMFGQNVNITDGRRVYMRAHASLENGPLYSYTATPSGYQSYTGRARDEDAFGRIEVGRYLPYTAHPVYKVPVSRVWMDRLYKEYSSENRLYDLESDYGQLHNLAGGELEAEYAGLLIRKMREAGAPEEQFVRLGLL